MSCYDYWTAKGVAWLDSLGNVQFPLPPVQGESVKLKMFSNKHITFPSYLLPSFFSNSKIKIIYQRGVGLLSKNSTFLRHRIELFFARSVPRHDVTSYYPFPV